MDVFTDGPTLRPDARAIEEQPANLGLEQMANQLELLRFGKHRRAIAAMGIHADGRAVLRLVQPPCMR
jgi:hypothetical protein